LHGAGAGEIVVVNRSPDAARAALALAGNRGRLGTAADVGAVDLVVNATPMGMAGPHVSTLPCDPDLLHPGQVVVDLVYEPAATDLLRAARARGVTAHNGLSMLVHQAAVAFELWTGFDAPVETMRTAATAALDARRSPPIEVPAPESAKDR
jgi:shikimate dehydrogenase